MTAFRPGDLAVVTGDSAGWLHEFEPGAAVEIVRDGVGVADRVGYLCRSQSDECWVAEVDLARAMTAAEPDVSPTPTPSPLDALIESALALIQDVRAGRVRIEATLLTPDRTDYRVIVTPEEKS